MTASKMSADKLAEAGVSKERILRVVFAGSKDPFPRSASECCLRVALAQAGCDAQRIEFWHCRLRFRDRFKKIIPGFYPADVVECRVPMTLSLDILKHELSKNADKRVKKVSFKTIS
ncbi:MAG: hypothetical protein WCV72_04880 [Patescibacteria group bacterium]